MSRTLPQLHEGNGWTTSRLSVAEVYNALDFLDDLFLYRKTDEEQEPELQDLSFLSQLMKLCDDLSCYLGIACADMIAKDKVCYDFSGSWAVFEMQVCLREMTENIVALSDPQDSQHLGVLVSLARKIKTILKRLDQ